MRRLDIADVVKLVEKRSGLKAFLASDDGLKVETIPFGVPQLDMIIGGGAPRGRIVLLEGDPSTGKTFLTQLLIRSAQRMGLDCIYFNAEQKFDPDWFATTKIDIDNLTIIQGNVAESVFDAVSDLIEKGYGLVAVDSLAALVPISENEDEMAQQTMGLQARVFSKGLRKLIPALSASNTLVVFTNQRRSGIGPYAVDTNPGGRAMGFYSSLTLHIRRGDWILSKNSKVEERVGFHMTVKSTKNTVAAPWREADLPFYFGGYVDLIESICQMALDIDIIEKAGSWFTFNEMKYQGWDAVLTFFSHNDDAVRELSEAVARARMGTVDLEEETSGEEVEPAGEEPSEQGDAGASE